MGRSESTSIDDSGINGEVIEIWKYGNIKAQIHTLMNLQFNSLTAN